jgi:hypothetical protein
VRTFSVLILFTHLEIADAELVLLAYTADPVHQTVPLPLPVPAATRRRTVGPGGPGGPARAAAHVALLRLLRFAVAASAAVSRQQAVARSPTVAAATAGAAVGPLAPGGPGRTAVRVAVFRRLRGAGTKEDGAESVLGCVAGAWDGAFADFSSPAAATGFRALKEIAEYYDSCIAIKIQSVFLLLFGEIQISVYFISVPRIPLPTLFFRFINKDCMNS